MKRCLIFLASVFLAFLAISSASTARPSDWTGAAGSGPSGAAGGTAEASWMTTPTPRLAAFVLIHL